MKFFQLFIILLLSVQGIAQTVDFERVHRLMKAHDVTLGLQVLDSLERVARPEDQYIVDYYRSIGYSILEDSKKSFKYIKKAIKNPNAQDSILKISNFMYADMLLNRGKYQKSVDFQKKLITRYPSDANIYNNLAYTYGSHGFYDSTLQLLNKALSLDSTLVLTYNNLTYYNCLSANYKKAIMYANKGLSLVKDTIPQARLLNNRGLAYLYLGEYSKGLADIDRSIILHPTNPYAYYNKAMFCIMTKNTEKICYYLELAKKYGLVEMTASLMKKHCVF